ncbi:MAG: hypothetical protein JWP69_1613 [Flaviaesturariibacter sp.]|nr:hypothetical protein [Flaviaesturariibacter sp.]
MQKILFSFLLFSWTFNLLAQEKAALTKEETVNYIQKKLQEATENSFFEESNKEFRYCWIQTISLNGDILRIHHSVNNNKEKETASYTKHPCDEDRNKRCYDCYYKKHVTTISFNPSYIADIVIDPDVNTTSAIGRMIIKLNTKTAKYHTIAYGSYDEGRCECCLSTGKRSETDNVDNTVFFYYLQADAANFTKLKKAFEHLRDLFKAEDDPFGQ